MMLMSGVLYPQGPVGELLNHIGRHNMRPNHLHMMFDKPGFRRLTTALYPEGDPLNYSDAVFGVKRSLVVVSVFFDRPTRLLEIRS